MSWFKNKENNFTFWIVFILAISGLILWIIPIIVLNLYESILANTNLLIEEIWKIEGSLQWWNNYYSNTAVPISTTLILLGLVLLLTLQLVTPAKIDNYLKTKKGQWYWIILTLIMVTNVVVFTIPETHYPLVYLRYLFGAFFVLWLPGYSFIKAIFSNSNTAKSFGQVEEIALTLAANLTIVPIVGLILNYLPCGIQLTSIIFGLVFVTLIFATIAIIRECKYKVKTS